jgi:hypothetical protein
MRVNIDCSRPPATTHVVLASKVTSSALVANFGLKPKQVAEARELIEEHLNEIRSAWAKHFPSGSH